MAPSERPTRGARAYAPALLAVFFGGVAVFAATPLFWPGSLVALIARLTFAGLCHQAEARSFVVDGHAMAVCHRCAGIYCGIPLGALLAYVIPLSPARLHNWALGAVPLAVQVILAWAFPALDLWPLRTATGLIAGGMGGLLLARATRS